MTKRRLLIVPGIILAAVALFFIGAGIAIAPHTHDSTANGAIFLGILLLTGGIVFVIAGATGRQEITTT